MSRPRADGSPARKVTEEVRAQVRALRGPRGEGAKYLAIAAQLGIPLTTAYRCVQPLRRLRDKGKIVL